MKHDAAYLALQKTAEEHGVPMEKVITEIETSILEAIQTAKAENNTRALNLWKMIPSKGEIPTATEFVRFMGEIASEFNK